VINYDRIKIQFVCAEQRISKQPLNGYREIRSVNVIKNHGVRVIYFDGGVEWFPDNTLVHVLKFPAIGAARAVAVSNNPVPEISSIPLQTSCYPCQLLIRLLNAMKRCYRHIEHT